PREAVTAVEVTDVRGELARAAGGAAKGGSVATLLFSMLLVSMPDGPLADPLSPTAVVGSIAGVTSNVEPIDASDDSCGSDRFGGSKCCGDDADLDVSPIAMESCSIAGAASTPEAIDTSADPGGSGGFGGAQNRLGPPAVDCSSTTVSGVNG